MVTCSVSDCSVNHKNNPEKYTFHRKLVDDVLEWWATLQNFSSESPLCNLKITTTIMTHYLQGDDCDTLLKLNNHGETAPWILETHKIRKEYSYNHGINNSKTSLILESVGSADSHESHESQDSAGQPTDSGRPSAPAGGGAAAAARTRATMRRHEYLATKYVQRWKAFVHERSEGVLKQTKRDTVDNFLDQLRKKKCTRSGRDIGEDESRGCRTMPVRDFRTYQHRYLVQKHIIAMQKAKLEEQNKVIEELKLKKIAHDSSESLVRMKEEIRKTYFEMDRKLKPKLQSLSKELKIKEFEEPTMVLNCLKVPQFLKRMEARAREREERHAVIRERRRQQDEERARIKHQEELERAEMDREEKNRRIKLLREKRRREKIENIRKKEHAERTRALRVMAELHHERSLMAAYGIRPLRLLVEMRRRSEDAARAHHLRQTTSNYFLRWMWHAQDMCSERNHKADQLYRRRLLTRAFSRFKELHRASVLKRQVAEDYSDLVVSRVVFRALRAAVAASRADRATRWRRAVAYYDGNLLFKTFTSWRALPALNALKREQEARKSKWRQKVLLVVPDYAPPDE